MAELLAVQIKEEPLDEEEACLLEQASGEQVEQRLENMKFDWSNLKALLKSSQNPADQQSDIITVDMSSLKGDNELNFMEKLTLSTQTNTCSKCLNIFYTNDEYQRHLMDKMCTKVPKIFPCAKLCGRYFKTAEQCKLHETEDHHVNEKSAMTNVKEKAPIMRYKLKSEFLKKPEPIKLISQPLDDFATTIKEEPKTPPPEDTNKFIMPVETTLNIKEEEPNIPEEMIVPVIEMKTEPEEILPDNWKNTLGLQLPANLKVVSMPITNATYYDKCKFKPISLPQNSAFKPAANGVLQIQSLPKNMKIVKIIKPTNIITTTTTTTKTPTKQQIVPKTKEVQTTFPVNIIQAQNNNSPMLVKLEKILPSTTKIQQINIPQVLKPANNNNNNTFPVNGGQYTVTMPFQRSYTTKLENCRNLEDIADKMLQESRAERVKKIQVESKVKLREIESLPQKRKMIKDMLQQIKMAEELTSSTLKCSSSISEESQNRLDDMPQNEVANQNSIATENSCKDAKQVLLENVVNVVQDIQMKKEVDETSERPSLLLPIMTTFDQEITNLEKKYPDYRFSWVCPKCPRLYEIKRAARNHLGTRHNYSDPLLEKTNIEYRGFPIEAFSNKKLKKELKKTIISSQDEDSVDDQLDAVLTRKRKNYTCPRCNRIFSGSGVLRDHLRANCSRDPQYPCHACSKRFYSASTLNCHLTIHTGELPHKCNFCDKRFRTRGQVTVHHRTHTGERPFVCQVCSQAFTHRETLIAHLSRHIGMKRYKCYGCNKHFSCISGLKTHRDKRPDTCAKVKFNPRAVGPRVRVIRGNVLFEPQPEINPYLRTEDPPEVLSEIQNQPQEV